MEDTPNNPATLSPAAEAYLWGYPSLQPIGLVFIFVHGIDLAS